MLEEVLHRNGQRGEDRLQGGDGDLAGLTRRRLKLCGSDSKAPALECTVTISFLRSYVPRVFLSM